MIGLSPEFLLAALIVVLIPGTGVLYTLATGISRGWLASASAALGCTLGIMPAIIAAALGLSAILHAGAMVFVVLKYAGAAYLFYLAWATWRDRGPIRLKRDTPADHWQIARTGALINVLNPKLSIFFMAFLPQFINPATSVGLQMAVMSATFMAMTFAVFLAYGALAARAGQALRRPRVTDTIRRATAVAFAGFGLRLAFGER